MLHANLKAVCSPQIASMWGGGGGGTGVHGCTHSGILEDLLSVFDNQYGLNAACQQCVLVFVSYSYDLWRKTLSYVAQKCPMLSFW